MGEVVGMSFLQLPHALIAHILANLQLRELGRVAQISREFCDVHVPAAATSRAILFGLPLPCPLLGETVLKTLQFVEQAAQRARTRIAATTRHILFVSADGQLASCGGQRLKRYDSGREGRALAAHLGHGHAYMDRNDVVPPTHVPGTGRVLEAAAASGCFLHGPASAMITDAGALLVCGGTDREALGWPQHSPSGTTPSTCSACARWAWREGAMPGQCSSPQHEWPELTTPLPSPVPSLQGVRIIHLSCGQQHTLALAVGGPLYSWGASTVRAALGHGGYAIPYQTSARRIDALHDVNIIDCSAGGRHSLAVSAEGQVYSWGENCKGRLGNGSKSGDVFVPSSVLIPQGVHICEVSAGFHSLAVSHSHTAYAWGLNNYQQLGIGPRRGYEHYEATPTRVACDDELLRARAGSFHSVFVTETGGVLVSGDTLIMPRGFGASPTKKPKLLASLAQLEVTDVAVPGHDTDKGNQSFIVISTRDGTSYAFGACIPGVQGDGAEDDGIIYSFDAPTPKLVCLSDVAAGVPDRCIAMTSSAGADSSSADVLGDGAAEEDDSEEANSSEDLSDGEESIDES